MSYIQLVLAIIATLAAVIGAIAGVVGVIIAVYINKIKLKEIIKIPKNWIPLLLILIFGPSALWLWTRPAPDPTRYGFESGTIGWVPETSIGNQGVTVIVESSERAKFGRYSLKLSVDIEGGPENRKKGEAYVEITPQNLENKPISVWVYVPKEALGDPEHWNGIQIFAKDADWRAEYGTWWNITPARIDAWNQVTLTPSITQPPDGYIEQGFDPTQIRAIGVKVAIGDGSIATYKGPIYIDAVDWPQ